jgi:hypothetical protein
MPTPKSASGMPNGDLAEELLRANSARLSYIPHQNPPPPPAQLPNQQWVSENNQVPNFAESGTETMCEIWRSHAAECGDYCLRAESGINKAPLQRVRVLSFAANHYSNNDQYTRPICHPRQTLDRATSHQITKSRDTGGVSSAFRNRKLKLL